MQILKSIITAGVAIILLGALLVPAIEAGADRTDKNEPVLILGEYGPDELDTWTATGTSSGYIVTTMWSGRLTEAAYIINTDLGGTWYQDGKYYNLYNGILTSSESLSASITTGTLTIGSSTYTPSKVYIPDPTGGYASYRDAIYNDPLGGAGSFAGLTYTALGDDLTTDSDYYLESDITDIEDKKGLSLIGSTVDMPSSDPFEPDIDHEDDPEYIPSDPSGGQTSGATGNCTWRYVGTTLYIEGTGATGNYSLTDGNNPPWYNYEITEVIIGEGVTSLGASTFANGPNYHIIYVSLPSTLTILGNYVFKGCTDLSGIDLPEGLVTISSQAFYGCTSLKSLICPSTVTMIKNDVIRNCSSLTHLYIPDTCTSIGTQGGFKFYLLDGTNNGSRPTGDLYLGQTKYTMYQTVTAEIDGATYHINYTGAELESAPDAESVHIPMEVEYNDVTYTVLSIGHEAVTGSMTKYLVIPQTVESISHTAITAANLEETLNLSAVEISVTGEVKTSIPATILFGEPHYAGSGATYAMMSVIPILVIAAVLLGLMYVGREE